MDSVRITMLAPFGIRPKGTLSGRMLPLAQALVRRGHKVSVVAPPIHNPADAGQRVVHNHVPVIHTARPTLPGPIGTIQQVLALLKTALAEAPDILHLFKPKGYSGLAALLARATDPHLPLVVDTDDWEGWGGWNSLLPYPRLAKELFAWQERDLPRRAMAITVASRTLETQVWGFGIPPERVVYLPNGINLDPLSSNEKPRSIDRDSQTILLYTRFWEFDVRDIVAALVILAGHFPLLRLLVVGRGERGEEHELLRLAERAGLARMVHYQGWVEPAHIPMHLASADIAIYPVADRLINRAKCSVKLLELMAAGLPIVAGRVGQVAEYLEHGRSGLLVEPGNPAALARGVLSLLSDATLRTQLGQAAQARARQYTWDLLAPRAEAAYALCLARRVASTSRKAHTDSHG